MKIYFLVFAFSALLLSCNSHKNQPQALPEGHWELVSMPGEKLESLFPNARPDLAFDLKTKRVSGKNGCNNFSGTFSLDADKLRFEPGTMIATKMFCEGGGENAFMAALAKADSFSVSDDGNQLELLNGKLPLLQFKKVDATQNKG